LVKKVNIFAAQVVSWKEGNTIVGILFNDIMGIQFGRNMEELAKTIIYNSNIVRAIDSFVLNINFCEPLCEPPNCYSY